MIPLVKNLNVDEINTSLIAIRKLLNNAGITETNITNIVGKDYDIIIQELQNQLNALTTYSTTEHWTGKYWIDGKKIYRKVIEWDSIPQNWTFVLLTLQNVSFITHKEAYFFRTSDGVWFSEFFHAESDCGSALAYVNPNGEVYVAFKYNQMNKAKLLLEYTKTTDN